MDKFLSWAMAAVMAVGMAVIIAVAIAMPIMLIWNSLMPALFGLKTITFWEALALKVLCDLLFNTSFSSK